jgi:protein disulfide-isomerase-like protein
MKTLSLILILFLLAIIAQSEVVTLTDKNFADTLKSAKYVMVKFYAPWCGHCKNMAPDYIKLSELVKDNDVIIGELDATVETKTAEQYEIQGYPSMKFFVDGVSIDYQEARTADQMFEWIKKVSENVLEVINEERLNDLKAKQNVAVYFGSNAEKRKVVELLNIVDNALDYFASDSDSEKLVLYYKGNSIEYPSDKNFTTDEIKKWTMLNSMPTVVPLISKEYLDWVFYDEATMKDVAMLLREKDVSDEGYKNFENFCEKNKETLKCCLVTKDSDVYGGVKGYLKGADGISTLALIRDSLK